MIFLNQQADRWKSCFFFVSRAQTFEFEVTVNPGGIWQISSAPGRVCSSRHTLVDFLTQHHFYQVRWECAAEKWPSVLQHLLRLPLPPTQISNSHSSPPYYSPKSWLHCLASSWVGVQPRTIAVATCVRSTAVKAIVYNSKASEITDSGEGRSDSYIIVTGFGMFQSVFPDVCDLLENFFYL